MVFEYMQFLKKGHGLIFNRSRRHFDANFDAYLLGFSQKSRIIKRDRCFEMSEFNPKMFERY